MPPNACEETASALFNARNYFISRGGDEEQWLLLCSVYSTLEDSSGDATFLGLRVLHPHNDVPHALDAQHLALAAREEGHGAILSQQPSLEIMPKCCKVSVLVQRFATSTKLDGGVIKFASRKRGGATATIEIKSHRRWNALDHSLEGLIRQFERVSEAPGFEVPVPSTERADCPEERRRLLLPDESFVRPGLESPSAPGLSYPTAMIAPGRNTPFIMRRGLAGMFHRHYLSFGAAIVWIVIPASDAKNLEASLSSLCAPKCSQGLEHLYIWPKIRFLRASSTDFSVVWQQAGDLLTFAPGSYFIGFATGASISESAHAPARGYTMPRDYLACGAICSTFPDPATLVQLPRVPLESSPLPGQGPSSRTRARAAADETGRTGRLPTRTTAARQITTDAMRSAAAHAGKSAVPFPGPSLLEATRSRSLPRQLMQNPNVRELAVTIQLETSPVRHTSVDTIDSLNMREPGGEGPHSYRALTKDVQTPKQAPILGTFYFLALSDAARVEFKTTLDIYGNELAHKTGLIQDLLDLHRPGGQISTEQIMDCLELSESKKNLINIFTRLATALLADRPPVRIKQYMQGSDKRSERQIRERLKVGKRYASLIEKFGKGIIALLPHHLPQVSPTLPYATDARLASMSDSVFEKLISSLEARRSDLDIGHYDFAVTLMLQGEVVEDNRAIDVGAHH